MPPLTFAVAGALLVCLGAQAAAPVFEVRTYGARGDGTNDDTAAIQQALDACAGTGGTVHFSAGTWWSRPLVLHAKTTVQLDQGARLQASPVPADYLKDGGDWLKVKSSGAFQSFISGNNLTDVVIAGPGTIDGNGQVWWPEAERARQKVSGYTLPRPNLISLTHVTNLRVQDITLQNSPKFHLVPSECTGVVISNTTILAPEHAANTDAIDPSSCQQVLITHCTMDVGDDNVAIKASRPVPGREFACEDITVTDCTFRHGHGLSIGSETAGGVRRVLVRNCTFTDTENGLRIKSQTGRGGPVQDIHYEHLRMTNVDPAITFTMAYRNNSARDAGTSQPAATTPGRIDSAAVPAYRDIFITDLAATCPRAAGLINGLPESCISNVVLENVTINAARPFAISNARGIQMKNSRVHVFHGPPFLLTNAQIDGVSPQTN